MLSWSQIAYNRGIQFIDIPFSTVNWINNLRFNKRRELVLITYIGKFRDYTIEPNRKHYTILDFGRTKRGQIQYNIKEDEDLFKERYIIARKKSSGDRDRLDVKEYYILVIRPTSIYSKYKRVRVRLIQSNYIIRQRFKVQVI